MSRFLVLALVFLASFSVIGAAAGTEGGFAASEPTDMDAERVLIEIQVDEDGDAVWTVEYRMRLENESDRAGFADLQEDIEADPAAYEDPFRERMNRSAAAASDTTGRDMAVGPVNISTGTTELPDPHGNVRYEFRWTNFANVEADGIFIGDALDGLFLDDRTVLLVRWPDGLAMTEVSPAPSEERSNAVVWRGPIDFGSGEPRVAVSDPGLLAWDRGLVILVIAALVGATGLLWMGSRRGWLPAREESKEPTEAPPAEVDRELLSNEEQVLQVVRAHGGRLKQTDLAEELDWTAAKTSQVTKDLRESSRLDGFRLGRENVLKLPDEEEGAESEEA